MNEMTLVASYIATRFQKVKGSRIDEMKLHKLMYLAQRESLARNDQPLFEANIEGWRLGPVLPDLRSHYKNDTLSEVSELTEGQEIVDSVFDEYSDWDSLELSRMTHHEICWRKSRIGIHPSASSCNPIPLDDILDEL